MTRGRKELNKVVDVIITKRGIQLPALKGGKGITVKRESRAVKIGQ